MKMNRWILSITLSFFLILFLLSCSEKEKDPKPSEGLAFMTNLDGTCFVSGIGTCTDEIVVIPSVSPKGDTVTSIGDSAFKDCTTMRSIIIPKTVTTIGSEAFSNCVWLKSVTIGAGVKTIKNAAFKDCKELSSVYYKAWVDDWCDISFSNTTSNPLFYAHDLFINDTLVTDLVIPGSISSIRGYSFAGCSSLTSVTIPKSITFVGNKSFFGCTGLESVDYQGDIAGWCEIYFADEYSNPLEYAQKLYINNTLVTDLVIPKCVTIIYDYAFEECTELTSVIIPEGVKCIGRDAFSGCTKLSSITIPNTVLEMGTCIFDNCSSLSIITYQGSKYQWNSITKIYNWYGYNSQSKPNSFTVRCTDGDINIQPK